MASVVIPAHNEENTLPRCLDALAPIADSLEIVVVCNGCTDGTAEVARRHGSRVDVIELERPSKAAALNAGDAHVGSFPRVFLDADVVFPAEDLAALLEVLRSGRVLAASPRLEVDTSASSWIVRSYIEVWSVRPDIEEGLVGRGVYGLSEAGRSRFDEFPDLMADDLFVHSLFAPEERESVVSARSVVRAPASVVDLVRQKTRVQAANRQLRGRLGDVSPSRLSAVSLIREHPRLIHHLPVFLAVAVVVRASVRYRSWRGEDDRWLRDAGSRSPIARGRDRRPM